MAQKTPDILKKIVSRKHKEIDEGIKRVPLEKMIELASNADETRGFYNELYSKISQKKSENKIRKIPKKDKHYQIRVI